MLIDRTIPQLLVISAADGPAVVAKSDGVPFAWENAAATAAARYGRPPAGTIAPPSVFAVPVGRTHAAVVQVSGDAHGLAFRFLVLNRKLYNALGDPFQIADRFPPDWSARGALALLEWPTEPLPPRRVEDLNAMMKAADGPLLLGAAQALLDGSRIMMKRTAPDDAFFRALWHLLPTKSRIDIWPATFAYADDLGFQVLAMPDVPARLPPGYISDDQARDYPEGRYELALQTAIESGNQYELDRLFARRSSQETLRLAAVMLAGAVVLALVSRLLS